MSLQIVLKSIIATVAPGFIVAVAVPMPVQADKVPVAAQEYVWVAANVSDPFYAEGKAAWDAAAKTLGVKTQFVGPDIPDAQQQIALIEAAIARPATAGILIYSANDDAIEPTLNKARAAGIPVIAGNHELKDQSARDAFVGTDDSALGQCLQSLRCPIFSHPFYKK
jgi:simple sugar transport system substrate-binding protein